ncbi:MULTISPECIES: hypothetical protein [Microbacterium]|uniref:Uncharacterized protein n=1 Tax=Microbacterium maritypicum MF109 TaxID=1333857 RepID=T5KFU2_MICMQ|nr:MULTISPECIES: hypothetical protein [Microbacterium]EQM75920.1 hypothetical protein L687_18590 [Microbacterium maritypicum MF109]
MPIKIDFLANTRDVERGTERVEAAFDDVSKSLDDVARDGDRSLDRLERSFKDLADTARDTSSRTEEIGDVGSRGFRRLGDTGSEVSGELRQNLGETFSSFRGDLEDLPQIAQDTLGGLAGSGALGGIAGLAVTAAGAAGLGLISAELQRQQEEANKLRERLAGVYQAAAEEGRNYIDTAQLIAEANSVMFDPDRADEWKRIQQDARDIGLDTERLIAANAGDRDAQLEVQNAVNAAIDEERRKREELGAFWGGQNQGLEETHLEGIRDRWQDIADVTEEYAAKADTAKSVTSNFLLDAVREAGEATEAVDEFGNKLYTLPDGTEVVIDAKTGQAHQNVDRFKGDLDGKIPTVKTTTLQVNADLSGAEGALNRFISQNNGRTLKINGRYVTPEGWDG